MHQGYVVVNTQNIFHPEPWLNVQVWSFVRQIKKKKKKVKCKQSTQAKESMLVFNMLT